MKLIDDHASVCVWNADYEKCVVFPDELIFEISGLPGLTV